MVTKAPPKPKIDRKAAIRELWLRGKLDYKRKDNQKLMKDFIHSDKRDIIPILASRRQGKSYELLMQAVELCHNQKNAIVKYVCPTQKMVKNIVIPNMKQILADCPPDLVPEWKENDKRYIFPNGSEIQFAGTDNGSHENLRGGSSHLCIVDEAGFCDHLEYVVQSVLAPTTDTTNGKVVLISTPSKTPNHEFITKFVKPARAAGNLLVLDIYKNPSMTEDKISQIASRYPLGKDDPQFRREYLCEIIADEESVVFPEFVKFKDKIVVESKKPAYYDFYTSGDVGFKDLTVYLFGYWDFLRATLVIEDELVMNGPSMTTSSLAKNILAKENELFTDASGLPLNPYMRVMDNNLIMINDLNKLHGLNFLPTAKDDKEAQINHVRIMMASGQIEINPRCKNLIYHLENAEWDKHHKKFEHLAASPNGLIPKSHADGADSLIYMVRNLVKSKNPYPQGWGEMGGPNVFVSRYKKDSDSQTTNTVKSMLNIKKK